VLLAAKEKILSSLVPCCAETCISEHESEGKKPHQGVTTKKLAHLLGHELSNSTTALGLRGQAALNRIGSRCTGKERDAESGLDYFGARYYSNGLGRWVSADPKGLSLRHLLNPQKLNKYSYVINNPMSFFDPNGMEELTIQLRAYIPQQTMLTYKGDNRGPTTSQAVTSRTEVKFGIETDQSKRPPGGYPPLLAPSQSKGGVTENFFTGNKAVQTEGLPAVTSAKYDDKGNAVITVQQNAVNPLSPNGTAAIRSDLTITVPADGSSVTTTGTLSGAPSFELNVFGPGGQSTNIPLQTAPDSTPAFAIGLYSTNTVNNTTPLPPPPPPKKDETPK
jgi:RHS repeat-associated protein